MNCVKRHLKMGAVVLSATLFLGGCEQKQPEKSAPVSRPVKLYTVGVDSSQVAFKYPGSVAAVNQSTLAFEVPGKIVDITVKGGDLVQSGQILARLDPRDYQTRLERARIERDAALKDYERYKKALKANAVTPQAFDQAKSLMEVTQSEFKQAQKALDDATLRAPFSGRVVRKEVDKFDTVHAKQPVLQLHSDSALQMVVDVPEADWAQGERVNSARELKLSDQLFVIVSALPNKRFDGEITEFSGAADPITRTYKVTVSFSVPQNSTVGSGMTGHVLYQPKSNSNEQLGVSIPVDAIVGNVDNSAFVWIYDAQKGVVTKKPIKLGIVTSSYAVVDSGLKKGDRIAISGVHSLFEGYPVYPLED